MPPKKKVSTNREILTRLVIFFEKVHIFIQHYTLLFHNYCISSHRYKFKTLQLWTMYIFLRKVKSALELRDGRRDNIQLGKFREASWRWISIEWCWQAQIFTSSGSRAICTELSFCNLYFKNLDKTCIYINLYAKVLLRLIVYEYKKDPHKELFYCLDLYYYAH